MVVRALATTDETVAREQLDAMLGGSRYAARALEQLDVALAGGDPEYSGLVVVGPAGETVAGLLLYGAVAGAAGVVRVHWLAGSSPDACVTLIRCLRASLPDARLLLCELADDEAFDAARAALAAAGFRREGRVPDFFADGVGLDLMVARPPA
ncbi:MAG: hypothetical protein ABJA80_04375 [bacterium]